MKKAIPAILINGHRHDKALSCGFAVRAAGVQSLTVGLTAIRSFHRAGSFRTFVFFYNKKKRPIRGAALLDKAVCIENAATSSSPLIHHTLPCQTRQYLLTFANSTYNERAGIAGDE